MPKSKKTSPGAAAIPIIVSPLNDSVIAAMFTDVESAGLAAEYLVKDVLGEYGKRLGKVISVTAQDYHKLANFRGCRVDVVCRADDNELWLIEFQMYDDAHMFDRNLVELSYLIIRHTTAGTTVKEMADGLPHIVVINFLDFRIRDDNSDWLQPAHIAFDKEPQRTAYGKLDIFNIQLPVFAEREPDFDNDGECWLYVMYQAHIKNITPQEVLRMDEKLDRFAETNPGFKQFETRFVQALADPDLLDILRMEASERMRQAGMKKAAEMAAQKAMKEAEMAAQKAMKEAEMAAQKAMKEAEMAAQKAMKEAVEKNSADKSVEFAKRLLKRNRPIEEIVEDTGLTAGEILSLQKEASV